MAEFEATRHINAHANRIFSIAEDSSRASSWMPKQMQGSRRSLPDRNRIEWGKPHRDEGSGWLEIRNQGRESDVTLWIDAPESDGDIHQELEDALRKLEETMNSGAVR